MKKSRSLMSLAVLADFFLMLTGFRQTATAGTPFPTPYAGTYYPIYGSGDPSTSKGEWITPTDKMPFDRVSAIFVAFAHTYLENGGAVLKFEAAVESTRLPLLVATARKVNPNVKVLISLGWEHDDWSYIRQDFQNNANLFVPSVVKFIEDNQLDGFDIDDESIADTEYYPASTGWISQADFDAVIANLREALDAASVKDNKTYYLTITPAGNNFSNEGLKDTQVDEKNARNFDLINVQTYFDYDWGTDTFITALKGIGYPLTQVAGGINTQSENVETESGIVAEPCAPRWPPNAGFAGLFNWNFSADSLCNDFQFTKELAKRVMLQ